MSWLMRAVDRLKKSFPNMFSYILKHQHGSIRIIFVPIQLHFVSKILHIKQISQYYSVERHLRANDIRLYDA